MAVLLAVLGVAAIAVSALLTRMYWRQAGLDNYEDQNESAAEGIVPSWVSLINIAGWISVLVTIVILISS